MNLFGVAKNNIIGVANYNNISSYST